MKKSILTIVVILLVNLSSFSQENTITDNFQKTDEVLSEVVKKALTVAEKTGEFAIENAPTLLKEFYTWHITKCSLGLFLSLMLLVILFNFHKKLNIKKEKETLEFEDPKYITPLIGVYVGYVFFFISLVVDLFDLVFVLVAPKLYLIEYFVK